MIKVRGFLKNGHLFSGEKVYINNDEIVLKNPKLFIGENKFEFDFAEKDKNIDKIEVHFNKHEVVWYYEGNYQK